MGIQSRPLCVDLDGTLIRSDLLWESLVRFIRRHPWQVWRLAGWLAQSKAIVKLRLASMIDLDVTTLPMNEAIVGFLRSQRDAGRKVILTTAATQSLAKAVADHTGLFDDVIASDQTRNLKRDTKLAEIQNRYPQGFDYLGDSSADLCLWRKATLRYVVGKRRATTIARRGLTVEAVFDDGRSHLAMLTAMRPHQWIKNLLVLMPVAASHQIFNLKLMSAALLAMVAFCLCASSAYLINDVLDIEHDRHHPRKRTRPMASGRVSILAALGMAWLLLMGGLGLGAIALPPAFLGLLATYVMLTLAYSVNLKRRLLVDVMALTALYLLRILAGGVATHTPPSFWLLLLSMFLFLSLALAKRFTELARSTLPSGQASGRGYTEDDLPILRALGSSASVAAVLVMALYINSTGHVQKLYPQRQLLWLICPLLFYGLSRMWFFAHRKALHDDPLVFALVDRVNLMLMALVAALVVAASMN